MKTICWIFHLLELLSTQFFIEIKFIATCMKILLQTVNNREERAVPINISKVTTLIELLIIHYNHKKLFVLWHFFFFVYDSYTIWKDFKHSLQKSIWRKNNSWSFLTHISIYSICHLGFPKGTNWVKKAWSDFGQKRKLGQLKYMNWVLRKALIRIQCFSLKYCTQKVYKLILKSVNRLYYPFIKKKFYTLSLSCKVSSSGWLCISRGGKSFNEIR